MAQTKQSDSEWEEEFLQDVAAEGLDLDTTRVVWRACVKHMAQRLATRKIVDCGYFVLVPHPLHPHWPMWLAGDFGMVQRQHEEGTVTFLTEAPMKVAVEQGIARTSVAVLFAPAYREASKAYESTVRVKGGYAENLCRWIEALTGEISEMWADYYSKACRKIWPVDSRAVDCDGEGATERYRPLRTEPVCTVELVEESGVETSDVNPETALRNLVAETQRVREVSDIRSALRDMWNSGRTVDPPKLGP